MGRLITATDTTASQTLVAGASYGPANELTSITGASGGWYGETLTYNSIKQLTSLASSGVSIAYNYPSSNNNGKIGSQTDSVSGETVSYTYDSLNRLITAQNQTGFTPLWGQSYSYDGFGNLTGTSVTQGSAPTLSATYDVNNHAGGEDANGNPPTSICLPTAPLTRPPTMSRIASPRPAPGRFSTATLPAIAAYGAAPEPGPRTPPLATINATRANGAPTKSRSGAPMARS